MLIKWFLDAWFSEYVASFAGVLVYMHLSVSAPSAQGNLHRFGFSVLTGIDVDGINSPILPIFKTSAVW